MSSSIKNRIKTNLIVRSFYTLFRQTISFSLRFTPLQSISDPQFHLAVNDFLHPIKLSCLGKVKPYTLNTYTALSNAYLLARKATKENIKGSYVECGNLSSGVALIMALVDRDRDIWHFDFSGNVPELSHHIADAISNLCLPAQKHHVIEKASKGVLLDCKEEMGEIAILRLNSSFYEPTKSALEALYVQVAAGGFIVFDDYEGYLGCREAVKDFLTERGVENLPVYMKNAGWILQKR
ncbi:MAG: TylF/MycF/NovP-related O-methyltransferase [Patescibacteria group bacterium]